VIRYRVREATTGRLLLVGDYYPLRNSATISDLKEEVEKICGRPVCECAFTRRSSWSFDMSDNPFITTASGVAFDLLSPTADMVRAEDIAHALARLCRFTGHCLALNYSVAQHSCLVASLVPGPLRLAALLHDAAEAYIGDLSSPLKAALRMLGAGSAVKIVEKKIEFAICERFDVDPVSLHSAEVKNADRIAYVTEKRDLMVEDAKEDLVFGARPEPCSGVLEPWPVQRAERIFLQDLRGLGVSVR
jgi:5'-deoxynucleotidase YfbR-like HD superfamily hydrolase